MYILSFTIIFYTLEKFRHISILCDDFIFVMVLSISRIAGIWQHFAYAGGIFGASYMLDKMWQKRMRNKDLVLFDYIQKHPEDFPEVFSMPLISCIAYLSVVINLIIS